MKRRYLVAASILLAVGLSRGRAAPASPDPCAQAKRLNHWCAAENIGYVASVPIRSRFLYEVLDAHGHHIIKSAVTCPVCRKAIETDGYCPAHKMGYVRGEAYMSPLTWHLARARRIDPSAIICPICLEHTRGIGWCERDRLGIAGYFAVADHGEFEELVAAYNILLGANEMSSRCETCAGAMITDGYCAIHHVTYAAGKVVSGTPP